MESEERYSVEGELPIEHELSRKTYMYTVTKLSVSTWYKFKVSASNSAGSSDYVETPRYVQTRPSLPYYKSKKLPWITDKSDSTLLLNWKKFESLGSVEAVTILKKVGSHCGGQEELSLAAADVDNSAAE